MPKTHFLVDTCSTSPHTLCGIPFRKEIQCTAMITNKELKLIDCTSCLKKLEKDIQSSVDDYVDYLKEYRVWLRIIRDKLK